MNYLIVIEYDGSRFNGWQIQKNKSDGNILTIESEILRAIKIVTGQDVRVSASGRTDTGVHALNQVANFKTSFYYDLSRLRQSLNGVLPKDIKIKQIELVHESFHSTLDALSKTYLYKINNGFKSPLMDRRAWYVGERLNAGLMNDAAGVLTGKNNFYNFVKRERGRHMEKYSREIKYITILKKNYGYDIFVEGEGFLRHMVRRIVGSIINCGSGKISPCHIREMLENMEENPPDSLNAPPQGLFLYSVAYRHKIYC